MKFINKYLGIIITITVIINGVYIFNVIKNKKEVELDEVILKEEIESKSSSFAIMLQNDDGEYAESNSNAYPTEAQGYRFNTSKSGCINNKGELVENALSFNNGVLNISVGESVQCYTYFDKLYTVSYDTDGGEFENTPPTKQVVYGDTYGDLPEPTKTGYTFKGWNGKNLFNYEEILKNNSDTVSLVELNGIQTISWLNNYTTTNQKFLKEYFSENQQYIFTGNIASETKKGVIAIVYTDSSFEYLFYSESITPNIFKKINFISSINKTISYLKGSYSNSERIYIDINSFQIEEGTVATEYEPYYIESDTKVVQRQNHTLKAIWEENTNS